MKRFTLLIIVAVAVMACFSLAQAEDPAKKPDLATLQLQLDLAVTQANAIQLTIQRNDALQAQRPQLMQQLRDKQAEIQALQVEIQAAQAPPVPAETKTEPPKQ